jgi:hypothetical protein
MQNEIDRFIAIDDNSNQYTVVILQDIVEVHTRGGVSCIPGIKEALTPDGGSLNCIDYKTFIIDDTGTIIRKVD